MSRDLGKTPEEVATLAVIDTARAYELGKGVSFCDPTHPSDCECNPCWHIKEGPP